MAMFTEDDVWRVAMAAMAVLRGRVRLRESRDETGAIAGFRGSMVTQYEWIDVQIFDPRSRAFAALPRATAVQHGNGDVDIAAYARATRRALALWTALAQCEGFTARENPAFWLRVLREVAPSISDVPRFFDMPDVAFPRFRLIFQPRDCYDEDLHDESDAVDWLDTFCDAFFFSPDDPQETTSELSEYFHQLRILSFGRAVPQPRAQVKAEFRVPVMRIDGPLGSSLQQHRGFLRHAQEIATRLTADSCALAHWRHVGKAVATLRGSIRPREFVELAPFSQSSSGLYLSGLCVDLVDEASLSAFAGALETAAVTCLTLNVGKATTSSIMGLSTLLQNARQLRTLRLFNAFAGDHDDRRTQWELLGRALSQSEVEELVLERTRLEDGDVEAFRSAFAKEKATIRRLTCLTIKPLTMSSLPIEAYIGLVQAIGSTLEQLDLSALCLDAGSVDNVLRSCPRVKTLCLGTIADVETSLVVAKLRQRACPLRALAMGCSEEAARCLLASLANQPPEIALAGSHLKELSLSIESMEPSTRDALLHMLDTNASLRYVHVKRRGLDRTAPFVVDEQLLAHHQRQLVRKLPVKHALAFLSVLSHHATASTPHTSALERFDTGVASEIVGFAGHAVRRRLHWS